MTGSLLGIVFLLKQKCQSVNFPIQIFFLSWTNLPPLDQPRLFFFLTLLSLIFSITRCVQDFQAVSFCIKSRNLLLKLGDHGFSGQKFLMAFVGSFRFANLLFHVCYANKNIPSIFLDGTFCTQCFPS